MRGGHYDLEWDGAANMELTFGSLFQGRLCLYKDGGEVGRNEILCRDPSKVGLHLFSSLPASKYPPSEPKVLRISELHLAVLDEPGAIDSFFAVIDGEVVKCLSEADVANEL